MRRSVILCVANASKPKRSVQVPVQVKRSPTDILKALNSTVGVDPTAPHFAFIDDPTTIPTTGAQKKNYFLAKELGKRAARQLAEEWPTLFAFDRDQPRLPAFRPEKPLDPVEGEASVEALKTLLDEKQVKAATRVFERLQGDGAVIDEETQLALFRLLAYYNADDPPLTEIEDWPGLRNFYSEGSLPWQDAGLADLLFETLPKNADTYSTMIAALTKFRTDSSVARASALLKEAQAAGLRLHEQAFNGLISVVPADKISSVLKAMAKDGVAPSVRTFNALLLRVPHQAPKSVEAKLKLIRQTLGEMAFLRIEPSLTTFSLVLETLYPPTKAGEQNPTSQLQQAVDVLNEALVKLEMGTVTQAVDTTDQYFFLNGLRVAVAANNDALVDRVEAAYRAATNGVVMTALTTESVFYSRFITFKAGVLPLEALERVYKDVVPRLAGTTRQLTTILVDRLSKEQRWSFASRVIKDSLASRYLADMRLASLLRRLLLAHDPLKMTSEEKQDYQTDIRFIVDSGLEFASFTRHQKLQVKLVPSAIAECALLLIRADQYNRAWELVDLLFDDSAKKGENAIVDDVGFISYNTLMDLLEAALAPGDWYHASQVLQLIALYHPKVNLDQLVTKIESRCPDINPLQRRMLKNFVTLRQ